MTFSTLLLWFLYFMIYAFLGWVCETIYCSLIERHFVERGFLRGPLCPIYGAGSLAVLWLLSPFGENIPLIFLLGAIVASSLEYITSFLMEKIFHMRWWDYSKHRFNLNGRVCMLNSVLFGILCVVLITIIHPLTTRLILLIPTTVSLIVTIALFIAFSVDTVVSVIATLRLKETLEKLKEAEEQLRQKIEDDLNQRKEQLEVNLSEGKEKIDERKKAIRAKIPKFDKSGDGRTSLRERLKESGENFRKRKDVVNEIIREKAAQLTSGERYLLRSFPYLHHNNRDLNKYLSRLRKALSSRKRQ